MSRQLQIHYTVNVKLESIVVGLTLLAKLGRNSLRLMVSAALENVPVVQLGTANAVQHRKPMILQISGFSSVTSDAPAFQGGCLEARF